MEYYTAIKKNKATSIWAEMEQAPKYSIKLYKKQGEQLCICCLHLCFYEHSIFWGDLHKSLGLPLAGGARGQETIKSGFKKILSVCVHWSSLNF